MKSIIIVFAVLISVGLNAQNDLKVYVPLKTKHFTPSADYAPYAKGEGGNIGAVLMLLTNHNNYYNIYSFGLVRNSYGVASVVAQIGVGKTIGRFNTSFSVGVASGYKIVTIPTSYEGMIYTSNTSKVMPNIFNKNGILPAATISVEYDTKLGINPLLNISPEFVNVGIVVNL